MTLLLFNGVYCSHRSRGNVTMRLSTDYGSSTSNSLIIRPEKRSESFRLFRHQLLKVQNLFPQRTYGPVFLYSCESLSMTPITCDAANQATISSPEWNV